MVKRQRSGLVCHRVNGRLVCRTSDVARAAGVAPQATSKAWRSGRYGKPERVLGVPVLARGAAVRYLRDHAARAARGRKAKS